MRLIKMSCPHCGGAMEISNHAEQAKCPYCDSVVLIERDAPSKTKADLEREGYAFEQGRIRAQQEAKTEEFVERLFRAQVERMSRPKSKNLVWWILGWLFLPAIPITILTVRTKKLPIAAKVVILSIVWFFALAIITTR